MRIQKAKYLLLVFLISSTSFAYTKLDKILDTINYANVSSDLVDFKAKTLEGELVKMSDFQGSWIILNFWATWCEQCLIDMKQLKWIESNFGLKNIRVVAVSVDDTKKVNLKRFVKKNQINYTVLSDVDPLVIEGAYQIQLLPSVYLVSPNLKIVGYYEGQKRWNRQRNIDSLRELGTIPSVRLENIQKLNIPEISPKGIRDPEIFFLNKDASFSTGSNVLELEIHFPNDTQKYLIEGPKFESKKNIKFIGASSTQLEKKSGSAIRYAIEFYAKDLGEHTFGPIEFVMSPPTGGYEKYVDSESITITVQNRTKHWPTIIYAIVFIILLNIVFEKLKKRRS